MRRDRAAEVARQQDRAETGGPREEVEDRAREENDAERVPVVEDGRLVGVLSRSVLQRRLAEDVTAELPPEMV